MFDVQGLPLSARSNAWRFFASVDANSWQEWVKPRGIVAVHIVSVGGGGGGGAGLGAGNPGARGGGGGGGTAALTTVTIPAIFVPDVLWINVGQGGAGGPASGSAGSSGGVSFVSSLPPANDGTLATLQSVLSTYIASELAAAGGGNPGTNSGAASGGSAGTASTTATALWFGVAVRSSIIGIVGANGGTAGNNVGSNSTIAAPNHSPWVNGAGGAACNTTSSNGGRSLGNGTYAPEGQQGGQSAINGGRGPNGTTYWSPLISTSGAGGASVPAGTGGDGGDAGVGSGGGGGGAGVTGGAGGRGGDGIVIITAW